MCAAVEAIMRETGYTGYLPTRLHLLEANEEDLVASIQVWLALALHAKDSGHGTAKRP